MHATPNPKVLVSYGRDTPAHKLDVLTFAELLVQCGIDVELDEWKSKRQDWSAWATEAILTSDYVIVVVSPDYKRAGDGLGPPHLNRGVQSEAALLRDLVQDDRATWTPKILPVMLPGHKIEEIPLFLQPRTASHFWVKELTEAGIEELLRVITDQPVHVRPPIGPVPQLPSNGQRRSETVEVIQLSALTDECWPRQPTLEMHLVPISPLPVRRLSSVAEDLAELVRTRPSLNGAERLEVNFTERAVWACSKSKEGTAGLALFQTGQRTAWTKPLRGTIGTVLVETDIIQRLSTLLEILISLDLPAPNHVTPAVVLAPLTLVRIGRRTDVEQSRATFPMVVPKFIQLTAEEPLRFSDLQDSVADIAEELGSGLIRGFRRACRR
jgi:hypothetical protein